MVCMFCFFSSVNALFLQASAPELSKWERDDYDFGPTTPPPKKIQEKKSLPK